MKNPVYSIVVSNVELNITLIWFWTCDAYEVCSVQCMRPRPLCERTPHKSLYFPWLTVEVDYWLEQKSPKQFFFTPTEECLQGSDGADVTESCISIVHV